MKTTETMDGKPLQFRVTVKARMYHGVLHKAMTRLGMNQTKMAEYLGISLSSLGEIMRLEKVPRFKTESGKRLKHKLEELTEITVSRLFPDHVFTNEFLCQDKTIRVTKDIPIHLLVNAGMVRQLTLPPDEELMLKEEGDVDELQKALRETMSYLSEREQQIIKLRFMENKTLREIASIFGVTRERIREIEVTALRSMRTPARKMILSRYMGKEETELWLTNIFHDHPTLMKKIKRKDNH